MARSEAVDQRVNIVMAGLVPAISCRVALGYLSGHEMAGTRPAMTTARYVIAAVAAPMQSSSSLRKATA